jgi:hypothetical protein
VAELLERSGGPEHRRSRCGGNHERYPGHSAKQQPINFSIVGTPSGPVAWHGLPSWYAVSGLDRMIDPAEERWMAKRAGSTTVEYATASHVGGITRFARRFTNLIERAVHATAA